MSRRDLAGYFSVNNKTKSGSYFFEKYVNLDAKKKSSRKDSDSSYEPSDPNAKGGAGEAEKYSSNSIEKTHV